LFWQAEPHIDGMSSAIFQIAAVVAGLLMLTSYFVITPTRSSLKRSMAVSVGAAVLAALLLTVLRNFSP
jgi:hypothetical protein